MKKPDKSKKAASYRPLDHDEQVPVHQKLQKAFEVLGQNIRSVSPLAIAEVKCAAVSPCCRGSKPYPTNYAASLPKGQKMSKIGAVLLNPKGPFPPLLPTVKVLLVLEKDPRFGYDLGLLRQLKEAYIRELARKLKASKKNLFVHCKALRLVVSVARVPFSIRVIMRNEISTLSPPTRGPETFIPDVYVKKTMLKMKLGEQLENMQRRFPMHAAACQLTRRWLASNYLSKTIEGLALELLVVHAFVDPKCSTPLTPLAGFAAFLRLLSTHDFIGKPVFVDMRGSAVNNERKAEIMGEFVMKRPALPPLVISTPEDPIESILTQSRPEPIILKRLIQLAAVSYSKIERSLLDGNAKNFLPEDLIKHSSTIYDIVIRFRGKLNVTSSSQSAEHGKNPVRTKAGKHALTCFGPHILPVADFNPSKRFIEELKARYGNVALFFYSEYDCKEVGVLLRPRFKSGVVNSEYEARVKNDKNETLVGSVPVLVEDFKIIGRGLVRDVIVADQLLKNEQ